LQLLNSRSDPGGVVPLLATVLQSNATGKPCVVADTAPISAKTAAPNASPTQR
jgi:hypothetical protein